MFRLTRKQYMIYAMMAAANFGSSLCVSLQAPFFPREAELKGATASQYGFVFGVFELVVFIMGPIYGKFMERIGPNFMCVAGIFLTGTTCVLFGQLDKVETTNDFIGLAFAIRITEALGNAGFITSSFVIIAKEYPEDTATVLASQESFYGLGLILGPTLGGILYAIDGYHLPFTVLGTIMVIISVSCALFMPMDKKGERKVKKGTYMDALRIKTIPMMIVVVACASYSIGCLQVGLEPHLRREFGLTPFEVGLMFVLSGIAYLVSAPIWGKVMDRIPNINARYIIALGGVFMSICFLLVGPAPFMPFEPKLWIVIVSLIFQGLAMGCEFVGAFVGSQKDALKNGMPDNLDTYGIISGLWMSSFAFGAFVGPTVSGFLLEMFGFDGSTLVPLVLQIGVIVTHLSYQLFHSGKSEAKEEETLLMNGVVYGSINNLSRYEEVSYQKDT